jgi:glycerol-3-phosphate cytidylyltransferase
LKKYKIGYTTGVFDLFHIGHLNVIKKAKEQCDHLIVAVTTDEEVKRVKNKVPVISFDERKAIVEALRYVDEVVSEDDTDKIRAWEKYRFNAIFKGDDWKGSKKWNEYISFFDDKSVDVVFFNYTEGTSSTKLREVLEKIMGK